MLRFSRVMLLAAVVLSVIPAAATAGSRHRNTAYLGAMWTKIFETPSPQNPFGGGDAASACIQLDEHTVAPFAPKPVPSCTVSAGTRIFEVAYSWECSTIENNGITYQQLLGCARANDVQVPPTVSVDGRPVSVSAVETGPLFVVLPPNNIFDSPAGTSGMSVAHGWVTLLRPLRPGTHTIAFSSTKASGTTTIVVTHEGNRSRS